MSWSDLERAYTKRGLVLVVGAGLSFGCGLPSWRDLLQRILTDDLHDPLQVGELEAQGLSLPAIASLIKERCEDRAQFVRRVRAALYRDFPYYRVGVGKSNRRAYVNYIRDHNPNLQAVAALCARRRPDAPTYLTNPQVHAVVTFNLDALLQAYVYARYEKRLLRTVERPSAHSTPGKISIYHMHGFLRFDRRVDDLTKEAPDAMVLTEQNYFDFFNQPTSLFNYTFMYLLREYPCCFIGLSLRDDNIRRLLHYSKREQDEALKREGVTDPAVLHRKLARHFAILESSGRPAIDRAVEQTLRPLGVTALWIADFKTEEFTDRLAALYQSTGDDWNAVF
ncbi:MAG: SIR2 family protein [Anaerolineae bacterium]|nr:SIR2 family protein [Anaerolineae bacterium]